MNGEDKKFTEKFGAGSSRGRIGEYFRRFGLH